MEPQAGRRPQVAVVVRQEEASAQERDTWVYSRVAGPTEGWGDRGLQDLCSLSGDLTVDIHM